MVTYFLAFVWALACPNHTHHVCKGGAQIIVLDDDTGGETGQIPPDPGPGGH